MRTEDGSIIHRCLSGDPGAFAILLDKYKAGIYAYTCDKLRNFQDAEDVTQEVFEGAYRNLRSLRRWESFAFWLYRIAANQCRRRFNARSRRPDGQYIEDQEPNFLDKPSVDAYRDNRTDESLHEALDSLSETYPEVLILHYFGGMTIRDIAGAIGASPTAIGVRLSRARAQLKEEMVAMMDTMFEGQKLQASFTFRIVEAVKRIHPMPRVTGLPWGLSLAAGIILAVLGLNPHVSLVDPTASPTSPALFGETEMTQAGEIDVDILRISQMPFVAGRQGYDDGGDKGLPEEQTAMFLAPRSEGWTFPEEPTAHLSMGRSWWVAYSPDGKILAVSCDSGIWLYNTENLNEIGPLEGNSDMGWFRTTISPDGKILASGHGKSIYLWDIQTQEQIGLLKGHEDRVNRVVFSPDGKLLASGSKDRTIGLWDISKRTEIAILELEKDSGGIYSLSFSPNGKILASGSYDDKVRLWDINEQKQVGMLLGHESSVDGGLAFSPDGNLLASGSYDHTIRLWDVQSQKQVGILRGHEAPIGDIAFSPDGTLLASAGTELVDQTVRLWDVQNQKQVGLMKGHTNFIWSVAFSPDGKTLASTGPDGTVRFWDVENHRQVRLLTLGGGVVSLAFSPDGKILASGHKESKTVRFWDTQQQKWIGSLRHEDGLRTIAFSPDGKLLATGNDDKTVRLWDVQKREQLGLMRGHTFGVKAVAFSPDGKLLASGSDTLCLWDVESHKQMGSYRVGGFVISLDFSPDGGLLALGFYDNNLVRLWDVNERKQAGTMRGHTDVMFSIAFSPGGKLLASGSYDKTIRLWDVQTQKQVGLLKGHTDRVYCVAFSPDGKILASGSRSGDGTVRLWDVESQEQVGLLEGHTASVHSIAFSKDGKWLASGDMNGSILLWEVNLPDTHQVDPESKQLGTWGRIKGTELLQNYPNPFNPETWIPFSLANPEHVIISIYNPAGQLVRTLDLGQKPSGGYLTKEKAAYWDGRNEAGEPVASDVYFYSMEAGGRSKGSRKMVLAR